MVLVAGVWLVVDLVTHEGPLVIVIALGCGLWGRQLRRSGGSATPYVWSPPSGGSGRLGVEAGVRLCLGIGGLVRLGDIIGPGRRNVCWSVSPGSCCGDPVCAKTLVCPAPFLAASLA